MPTTNSCERGISRPRIHARLGVVALCMLAFIAPAGLRGQGLDHGAIVPLRGPVEMMGRAGVGALTSSPATVISAARVEIVEHDTSARHGSRTHHAAVGALIGGAVGLVIGVVGDRPGAIGTGELAHGSWHNLWLITAPIGAAVGALIGTAWPAD